MGEYSRSSGGPGCLGCQPSGFGLFKAPTIGMGTEWVIDWPSGQEAQAVSTGTPTISPLYRMIATALTGKPSQQAAVGPISYVSPGGAAPTQVTPTEPAYEPGETYEEGRIPEEVQLETGAPGWVGPAVMAVVGLAVVGGGIWALKKFDVI